MFSVVLPVYNSAPTIRTSVESILNQTLGDFEIVIVDDGSTDATPKILAGFDDPRIRLLHQTNNGVSAARNRGIENSRFPFICFLDADDIWYVDHLATLAEMIRTYPNEVMFATCHGILMNNGSYVDPNSVLDGIKDDMFMVNNMFRVIGPEILNTNSICIASSAFEATGMFEVGATVGEDTDMWFRMAAYYNLVLSKKVTTLYRRTYSTATRLQSIDFDWPFETRHDALMSDPMISIEKKQDLLRVIDTYRISKARHYLLGGERQAARDALNSIRRPRTVRKELTITALCFLIPHSILSRVHRRKHANFYSHSANRPEK